MMTSRRELCAWALALGAGLSTRSAAAFGDMPWPGNRIAQPFLPLIELVTPPPGNQLPPIAQIRDLLGNLYGSVSAVASAPSTIIWSNARCRNVE